MKTLSPAQVKKIELLINNLVDIQFDLFNFPNENAGLAAFEIDAALNILKDYKTWYQEPLW